MLLTLLKAVLPESLATKILSEISTQKIISSETNGTANTEGYPYEMAF